MWKAAVRAFAARPFFYGSWFLLVISLAVLVPLPVKTFVVFVLGVPLLVQLLRDENGQRPF
jgi:hypothetical protein